jgi:hypothetical protein
MTERAQGGAGPEAGSIHGGTGTSARAALAANPNATIQGDRTCTRSPIAKLTPRAAECAA